MPIFVTDRILDMDNTFPARCDINRRPITILEIGGLGELSLPSSHLDLLEVLRKINLPKIKIFTAPPAGISLCPGDRMLVVKQGPSFTLWTVK